MVSVCCVEIFNISWDKGTDIDSSCADHLIGTPLAFASAEYAAKAWTLFQDIPALQTPAVKFVRGSITGLDSENKFATIAEHGTQRDVQIPYDYFVAATGLRRVAPSAPQSLSKKQYIVETANHIRTVQAATEGVIVVGAGKHSFSRR